MHNKKPMRLSTVFFLLLLILAMLFLSHREQSRQYTAGLPPWRICVYSQSID